MMLRRLALAAVLLLTLAVVASEAQQMVRFAGSVQWIAGNSMQRRLPVPGSPPNRRGRTVARQRQRILDTIALR